MQTTLVDIIKHAALLFVGVILAALLVPAVTFNETSDLILAALVLAVLNSMLKPVLVLFVLPFIIFTFGLGLVLVNAVLLYFSSVIVPGFEVGSFWGAVFGALIVSITNGLALVLLMPRRAGLRFKVQGLRTGAPPPRTGKPRKPDNKDVIDV